MAEYWKSAPRHWCKQCKIFIRDTPFEKTQHEASPKHQGSLKRFLRDIHKNNEIQQRDSQRAKSEVERLRQAVGGGGSSTGKDAPTPSTHTAAPAPKSSEKPGSLEDRKKQMAQLAEMGVAIPQEYRAEMSLAGEWQTLSETKVAADDLEGASKSIRVRKRKHEGDEEEETDEHAPGKTASLGWGSKLRTYPGQQDEEDDDLDALLSSSKDLKKVQTTNTTESESRDSKQQPAVLAKKEEEVSESMGEEANKPSEVKAEEAPIGSEHPKDEKPSTEEVPGFSFKKRKPKVMRK